MEESHSKKEESKKDFRVRLVKNSKFGKIYEFQREETPQNEP